MQPSAVTISAARQSPSEDMRSIGDAENAAALKAWGGQLSHVVSSSERGSG
jgi:hypothetical protein